METCQEKEREKEREKESDEIFCNWPKKLENNYFGAYGTLHKDKEVQARRNGSPNTGNKLFNLIKIG